MLELHVLKEFALTISEKLGDLEAEPPSARGGWGSVSGVLSAQRFLEFFFFRKIIHYNACIVVNFC